jgi:NADH-quinone oxidoreductase subunit J
MTTLGTGNESALATDIAFWVIAVSGILAAIAVVQLRDMFRAAMFLVVSFLSVAAMFVLLRAEFLAVVQVLVYVGAISVLIIFAVLMTRDVKQGNPSNRLRIPAGIVASLLLLSMGFVAIDTEWNLLDDAIPRPGVADTGAPQQGLVLDTDTVDRIDEVFSNTVPEIAGLLLRDFVLAFEVASVLLLAAIIGALALVREQ